MRKLLIAFVAIAAVAGASVPVWQAQAASFQDPIAAMLKNYTNACSDLREAVATLRRLSTDSLSSFNQLLTRNNVGPIPAPSTALAPVSCTSQAPVVTRGRGRTTGDH